jgi:hypothetical protein|tara:strand:+ start:606 stop:839 length:234 start_codon:yes stop_codon:yes gene_type:complete
MTEENKQKSVEAIANTILQQLNLNGVIEASKFYSINLANKQYAEMSDEDKQKLLDNMQKIDEEQAQPQVENAPVEVV